MFIRTKLLAAAGAMVAAAAVVVPAAQAQAATPWCVAYKYYNMAAGGCDGNNTSGSDRLWVKCEVIGSDGYDYTNYGTWHNRYADWQQDVWCNDNATAIEAGMQHRN